MEKDRKMLTCRQAQNLFDAYLDHELSESMRTELHAHRLRCSWCKHQLALMEACRDVIRSGSPEPRLSEDFTDRVLVAWARPSGPRPRRTRRITIFLTPAARAAAAALVLMFMQPWEASRPKPTGLGLMEERSVPVAGVSEEAPAGQRIAAEIVDASSPAEYLLGPLLTSSQRALLRASRGTTEAVDWLVKRCEVALEPVNAALLEANHQQDQEPPPVNQEPTPEPLVPFLDLWDIIEPPETAAEDVQVTI